MTPLEKTLLATIDTLTKTNESQDRQIEQLTVRVDELLARIAWLQRKLFGKSSEKSHPDTHTSLFSEEELGAVPQLEETCAEQPEVASLVSADKSKRRPVSRARQGWKNLPVLETVILEPEGVDLQRYRRIGEEVSHTVELKPGMLYRKEIIQPKYGLKDPTEPVKKGKGVLIAPMPPLPIPKGMAGASLLSEIILKKYEYHMPFYRQIKEFAHLGMEGLKEATVVGWYQRTVELLRPLYDLLACEVMKTDYVQADETTVPVINNEKHQADKECLWMARSVMERLVVFFYDDGSRGGRVIKDLTDRHKFKGYLQCDGFGGYEGAYGGHARVWLVYCRVHIRRQFERALDENREAAEWFLSEIRELYRIEHECDREGLDFEARKAVRLQKTAPLMEEMRQWMENEGLYYSERTLIGKAVTYAWNRWQGMKRVLEDGRLRLDNNLGENEIRPVTLGRKNYLFCGNHESAGDMCVILSLLNTARNHDVNPRPYLNDIIARMPYKQKATPEELLELLPHRWIKSHPEALCKDIRSKAK